MKRQPFVYGLFLVVAGVFLALGVRCAYLQVMRHDSYLAKALGQERALVPLKGGRGVILDRCGRVLAASNRTRSVYVEPRALKDPKETAVQLASVIKMPAYKICARIVDSKSPGYARIKDDVSRQDAEAARQVYGVNVEYNWHRYYPAGNLTCHVVGFTDPYGVGLAGLEATFNSHLAGASLEQQFLADSARRPIRPLNAKSVDWGQLHGGGLILTLDANIQEFTRQALYKQMKAFEAESALAIVAEVKTGAILAMVSLPDFDPTQYSHATPAQRCNHAVIDQFEPGSIIKPIVMAIAMDAGKISRNEKINCENGLYCGKGFGCVREYNYHRYGILTPKEILVHSSNIGMAKIGQRLGAQRLYRGLHLFGFGRRTGIQLSGEAEGLLRTPDKWDGYSITRIPFGQEISVSALQLIQAYCILANQGRIVKPHLIEAVVDANGRPDLRHTGYRVANQVGYVINPDVARWVVQDAMVAVVNEGTGRRVRLDHWQVFGKTGTAQIARPDGKGYEDDNIASFVAGAPADDPLIITLVSIRRPNRKIGRSGGVVASPVAGQIIGHTMDYFEAKGWISPPKQ